MQHLPAPLAPLGEYRQFILYRLVPDGAKTQKKPISPRTLTVADPHNPTTWVSFDEAAALLPALGPSHGIGFVFTRDDPFWFLDIDGAWNGTEWNAAACEAYRELGGCAVEVSQSGTGLHIFGTGEVPAHASRNAAHHIEFYTEKRFVALTGSNTSGDAGHDPGPKLAAYVNRHFAPSSFSAGMEGDWWSVTPVATWRGPEEDNLLITRALKSRSGASVFGGRASFADLWEMNVDVLAVAFPADKMHQSFNASTADAALAQHLCFWTGNNAERVDRLMRQSALVRPKWDDRSDYLPRTIRTACSMQTEFLADAPPSASPFAEVTRAAPVASGAVPITESTYLSPEEQVNYFAGCAYVVDEDRFMLPNGDLVDSTRFNRVFGGRTFVMDAGNERTSRKAAEAFTESQAYRFPRVDAVCFRPRAAPGAVLVEAGRTKINTWVPVEIPRAPGDASRFWKHIAMMLPDAHDQKTLVYYMAGCVQLQGLKFQWAPLIQGTTGNGKSMLSKFVRKAIGKKYCHTPRAKNIDNDFNAWMSGRTFYSVDEIYIPDKRLNILETLKEMITSDEQEVTKKGVDSGTQDVCGNFMFFTNHRDGIKKNKHERRIAPFYTAQQMPEDLEPSGMTEAYFRDLVDWLEAKNAYDGQPAGYSIIAELLWTIEIPAEYDPSKMPRAPRTSSTDDAIVASRGPLEQEIVEAIETGAPGFRGGWVSSIMLRKLCADGNHRVPLGLQHELLLGLGYQAHPALLSGRVNNDVAPDGGRPKLYVKTTAAELLALRTPGEVAHAYVQCQLASYAEKSVGPALLRAG